MSSPFYFVLGPPKLNYFLFSLLFALPMELETLNYLGDNKLFLKAGENWDNPFNFIVRWSLSDLLQNKLLYMIYGEFFELEIFTKGKRRIFLIVSS